MSLSQQLFNSPVSSCSYPGMKLVEVENGKSLGLLKLDISEAACPVVSQQ